MSPEEKKEKSNGNIRKGSRFASKRVEGAAARVRRKGRKNLCNGRSGQKKEGGAGGRKERGGLITGEEGR